MQRTLLRSRELLVRAQAELEAERLRTAALTEQLQSARLGLRTGREREREREAAWQSEREALLLRERQRGRQTAEAEQRRREEQSLQQRHWSSREQSWQVRCDALHGKCEEEQQRHYEQEVAWQSAKAGSAQAEAGTGSEEDQGDSDALRRQEEGRALQRLQQLAAEVLRVCPQLQARVDARLASLEWRLQRGCAALTRLRLSLPPSSGLSTTATAASLSSPSSPSSLRYNRLRLQLCS